MRAVLKTTKRTVKLAAIPTVVVQTRLEERLPTFAAGVCAEDTVPIKLGLLEVQVCLPGVRIWLYVVNVRKGEGLVQVGVGGGFLTRHLVRDMSLLAVIPKLDVVVPVRAVHDPVGVAAGTALALGHAAVEVVVVVDLDRHDVAREEVVGQDGVDADAGLDAGSSEQGGCGEGLEEPHGGDGVEVAVLVCWMGKDGDVELRRLDELGIMEAL